MIAILLALRFTTGMWNAIFSGLIGPSFALDMQIPIREALRSSNWDEVLSAYNRNLFLDESVLVLGSANTGYDGGLVASRGGGVESIAIEYDKKMPLASGSKWISGAVIYAVISHPLTNLTAASTPSDYFPFWTCTNADDILCRNITVEKLLAFRSGLRIDGCERAHIAGLSWETCVERIHSRTYDPSRFDTFEYGPVGLTVAGLMALKEMQKLPGYEEATWQDVFQDLVLDKAGITDAPFWNEEVYTNGRMTYDFQFLSHGSSQTYNPQFPDLSASLGCSPRQYSQFAHAFLAGKLFGSSYVQEMTRSHGETPMFYGFDLETFQGYGQTMWYAGRRVSHSVGYYGFFPWIDQSDPDPSNHFFGVIAVNYRSQTLWAMRVVVTYVVPMLFIAVGGSAFVCYSHRRRKGESTNFVEEEEPPQTLFRQKSVIEQV